ncbi:MAG TPA: hypothetical protein VMS18_16815 [Candidatus Binatia bacterium]|nr:hypothetical protein [Candidatus Binatia bacterium]
MPSFVYTITLASGSSKFEGIPVFGFAPVDQDPGDPSFRAQSAHDVRDIVWQAAGARGMTLAVPYPEVYKYFNPKTQYETLTIYPNDKPDDQFNSISETYTFDSIVVGTNSPMDFGTFKVSPREMQWIYSFGVKNLKNKYGTDVPGVAAMFRPFAVKLGFDQLR